MASGDVICSVTKLTVQRDEMAFDEGSDHAIQEVSLHPGIDNVQQSSSQYELRSALLALRAGVDSSDRFVYPSGFDGTKRYTITITEE